MDHWSSSSPHPAGETPVKPRGWPIIEDAVEAGEIALPKYLGRSLASEASCSILQQLGSRLVTVKQYNSYQWDYCNGIIILVTICHYCKCK